MKGTVTKINRREDPEHTAPPAFEDLQQQGGSMSIVIIEDGDKDNHIDDYNIDNLIGNMLFIADHKTFLRTSPIKSIYEHTASSGRDKLVLPDGFPTVTFGNLPELYDNDILVATMNSVYLIRPDTIKESSDD